MQSLGENRTNLFLESLLAFLGQILSQKFFSLEKAVSANENRPSWREDIAKDIWPDESKEPLFRLPDSFILPLL